MRLNRYKIIKLLLLHGADMMAKNLVSSFRSRLSNQRARHTQALCGAGRGNRTEQDSACLPGELLPGPSPGRSGLEGPRPSLACTFLAHHVGSWWSLRALSIPFPLPKLFFGIQSNHRMEKAPHNPPQIEKVKGIWESQEAREGMNEDVSS